MKIDISEKEAIIILNSLSNETKRSLNYSNDLPESYKDDVREYISDVEKIKIKIMDSVEVDN